MEEQWKVEEDWGLVPCSYPGSFKAADLFVKRCRALQGCKVTQTHTHTRRVSVSWAHKAVTHTLQTHTALSSPPFFLNVVEPCLTYYSERRWRAHTEISTQTTLCPSGPDSYLLIPAESVPDITLSYETARSVIPSISSEMARGKNVRSHTLLSDLVERKSGYEQ